MRRNLKRKRGDFGLKRSGSGLGLKEERSLHGEKLEIVMLRVGEGDKAGEKARLPSAPIGTAQGKGQKTRPRRGQSFCQKKNRERARLAAWHKKCGRKKGRPGLAHLTVTDYLSPSEEKRGGKSKRERRRRLTLLEGTLNPEGGDSDEQPERSAIGAAIPGDLFEPGKRKGTS